MPSDVLRVWLISSFMDGCEASFHLEELEQLGKSLHLNIELKMVSWNRAYENVVSAFKNGNEPDVFQFGTTWAHTLSYLGYLAPVPSNMDLKPSLASWMDKCSIFRGVRTAVPWNAETIVLTACEEALSTYRIKPSDLENWDGFYKVCGEIAAQQKKRTGESRCQIPLAFPIRPEMGTLHRYIAWLWAGGWSFPDLKKIPKNILANETCIKTFEYISRLMQVGEMSIKDVQIHPQHMYERFYDQKHYAFYIGNWCGIAADAVKCLWESRRSKIPFTMMPIPYSSPDARPWGGGSMLGVSSRTRYPEAAWRVIKHIISDRYSEQLAALSGYVPAFESDFWDKFGVDERIKLLHSQIIKSETYPFHPLWRTIEHFLSVGIADFLWRMMEGGIPESDQSIASILQETDRNVINLLKMTWEMDHNE